MTQTCFAFRKYFVRSPLGNWSKLEPLMRRFVVFF